MRCPACQTESTGAYCPECGTPLRVACASCGATLQPAARFCTQCGSRARAHAARSNAPWYIAGTALLALSAVVLLPGSKAGTGSADAGPAQTAPMLVGGTGAGAAPTSDNAPPPLTGTPREQADRLFNLIMENKEKGDTAKARFFVPMGLQAYAMAGQLDADGLYHLSLLQTLGGNGADGVATARKILAVSPDNLLGLVAAAQGEAAAGQRAAAAGYYQHFLAVFPTEKARDLPEYRDHAAALPQYQEEARRFVKP